MDHSEFRQMTLDNMKCISKGGTGECFQIDEDKILKLYYEGMPVERAVLEKECAREAFIIGVPTAISYEKVQVGNRYGVIYEKLSGKTLSQAIKDNPERIGEYADKYSAIAKSLHSVKGDIKRFDSSTTIIRKALKNIDYLSDRALNNLNSYLDMLDGYDRYVHGDFHPNNIIVSGDELTLIDMGGFSVGCPMFDLATTYFCMFLSPDAVSGEVSPFTGLTRKQHADFWNAFSCSYFSASSFDEAVKKNDDAAMIKDIALLKLMRFERLYRSYVKDDSYYEKIKEDARNRWEKQ